jgi:hypothetical protein
VEIDERVFELGMTQQNLDRAQIGASLQEVGRIAVPQRVRRDVLGDAGLLGGLPTGFPGCLGGDGDVRPPVPHGAGKQIRLGLHPAPINAKRLQEFLAQRHIAITIAFAVADVDHHAFAVDIGDLQAAQFRATHASGVQRHEHSAVEQVTGCIDQPGYLIRA